jgi:1-acyl-sn-glycerol-3-phosphate acyltransferase
MALEGSEVLMVEVIHQEAVVAAGEELGEPPQLPGVGADGVGASVGLQLKPADVFVYRGLEGERHGEAAGSIIDAMARALEVVGQEPHAPVALPAAIDDFGFDPAFTERLMPLALWFYNSYWRVESEGVENVPASGRALLVANHAGVVPYDGAMIRTAIWAEHPRPRHARMLVVDWAFAMPFVSMLLQRTGNVLAHPGNATELLERDQLVGVFPEGVKGAAKPFKDRYRVRRLGRGGFVQVALRTRSPLIPVAVVGAEEIHPVVADLQGVAQALKVPAFPITPTFPLLGLLGLVPLPSKWLISFGEPIDTSGYGPEAAEDPTAVMDLSEQIRLWIQGKLHELLARRGSAFA